VQELYSQSVVFTGISRKVVMLIVFHLTPQSTLPPSSSKSSKKSSKKLTPGRKTRLPSVLYPTTSSLPSARTRSWTISSRTSLSEKVASQGLRRRRSLRRERSPKTSELELWLLIILIIVLDKYIDISLIIGYFSILFNKKYIHINLSHLQYVNNISNIILWSLNIFLMPFHNCISKLNH